MSHTFVVCSLSNRPEVSGLSWPTIDAYCSKHGYTFHRKDTIYEADRHPSWSKIPFLMDLVSENVATKTIIVWMDDDMMITNHDIRMETLLAPFIESTNIMAVQRDTHGELFNCGFIAVKCSNTTFTCLKEIWNACNTYEKRRGYWEQTTMQRLYRSRQSQLKSQLYIFPPKTLQSFFRPNEELEYQWSPGDFIAHVSGLDLQQRIHFMNQLQTYLRYDRTHESDQTIHTTITHPK